MYLFMKYIKSRLFKFKSSNLTEQKPKVQKCYSKRVNKQKPTNHKC